MNRMFEPDKKGNRLMSVFLPAGLAFLMFVVGLRLTLTDFRAVFATPTALLTGLLVQVCLLPLAAVFLARAFDLSVPMATGLVILSVSPGGITSNYIAMLARADVALSAAMTLITSAAAAITVPLILHVAGQFLHLAAFGEGGLGGIAIAMALVSILPLLLGIGIARFLPVVQELAGPVLDKLSKVVFAAIVISTFVENWNVMSVNAGEVGLACILLNLIAIGMAFAAAWLARLPGDKSTAIAVEAGMQNAAISMFIAANLFGDAALAIPALIYALAMNVTALILITVRNAPSKRNLRNA